MAGVDVAFRLPEAARDMLVLPRRWGSATEKLGSKVTSVAPRCLTTTVGTSAHGRVKIQVRAYKARQAGFEPATRCLEGSRSIRLSYWRSVTIVQGKDHVLATRGSQCRAA